MSITLIKETTNINFTGFRRIAYGISAIAILASLLVILVNGGLRYGVDFAGGVMVQVQFENQISDEKVKEALGDMNLPGLVVQESGGEGRDYLIRFGSVAEGENSRAQVLEALSRAFPDNAASIQRMEMVGPKVGEDLRNMAMEALFYSVLLMTVYISGRFENSWFTAAGVAIVLWAAVFSIDLITQYAGMEAFNKMYAIGFALMITIFLMWKLHLNFALGAILSLMHDVIITVGLLTLLGYEIDLNIIAALLTLVGYSLNDSIIVYDRIRENLQEITKQEQRPSMAEIINLSINQTLSRTIMTSVTTLFVCLSLFVLGGTVINGFAFTILVGIIVGTYSSPFVASPILMAFGDADMYLGQQVKDDTYDKPGEHGLV